MHKRILCFVLAFSLLTGNLSAQNTRDISIVPNTQKWAILVGVNDYNSLRKLNYAVADTVSLRDRLIDIGFLKEQICCLISGEDAKNMPTKNNIENQVELVAKNANEGDLIILALSGHGVKGKSGKSYFCPSDTNNMSAETIEKSCVSIDWIYETLKRSEAKFKLILVDACRNDPFEGGKRGDDDVTGLKGFSNPPDGIVLLQSCEEGTFSYEDEELGQGIFTYTLIQGLNGQADVDKDGSVSLMDLLSYTMKETNNYVSKRFRTSQKPRMSGQTGDFEIVNLGNLSVSEREKAEHFYQEAMAFRRENKFEDALHRINSALAINKRSEAYFNERATVLQLLGLQTNVTSGGERYERPQVTTTDPLQRALQEVDISINRRKQLEKERLTLLEDYPPTHAKVKSIEKKILAEGVLYAGYVDQANNHLGTEIEIKTNLIKDYLTQGMLEGGKSISETRELIERLKTAREKYTNIFQPESYLEMRYLFANRKPPNLSTPTISLSTTRQAGEYMVLTIKGVEYPFCWCPAGSFTMGSPENEIGYDREEKQHHVTLTRGFWCLETEVTQKMWESVTGSNPSKFKGGELPVEQVSWNDCQEYIKKLNKLGVTPSGFRFSLPTEAQWEYACRAGTTTALYNGKELTGKEKCPNLDEVCWYRGNTEKTHEVGDKEPNAWGLYDMYGNVSELCLDRRNKYPEGSVTDPTDVLTGEGYRVYRGGGWSEEARRCRSGFRNGVDPKSQYESLGLRIVLVGEQIRN